MKILNEKSYQIHLNNFFVNIQKGQSVGQLVDDLQGLSKFKELTPANLSSSKTGDNPLHIAARFGHLDFLKYLIDELHWNVELRNLDSKTGLHEGAYNLHLDLVQYLIKVGANVNTLKKADWTPLMLCCVKVDCNPEIIDLLLTSGADPKFKNKDGWNSLHLATRTGLYEIVVKLVNFIKPDERYEFVNSGSKNGRKPLITAAMYGRLDIAQYFLDNWLKSEDIEMTDNCGNSPLIEAARFGHLDLLQLFIKKYKADLTKRDKCGHNILQIAAEAGQSDVINTLICEYQFDPNEKVNEGLGPLQLAIINNQMEAKEKLISLGATDSAVLNV